MQKFKSIKNSLKNLNLSPSFGLIDKILGNTIVATGIQPSIGDIVKIVSLDNSLSSFGMVTAVENDNFSITPFGFVEGYKTNDKVLLNKQGMRIPVSDGLLGRVVNPLMEPIDGKEMFEATEYEQIIKSPMKALDRGLIDKPFPTGVKSIDGLLSCGEGQKLGIFAGSGVGKSTLMGMIVRGSKEADIKVIALIGERGREVPEFIEKNLNGDLTNTVLIVATSDDSALMRKYGAFSAMSVAEYFKSKGRNVLFMMDSVTRFAMAQREIGLALGEPPTSKGYPPSSITLLPQLMERAGKEVGKGSITAFFTVLIEGDDMNDPIADQTRSILDGHFVLSRELTDYGIYPPINILNSASRVMGDVTTKEHRASAMKLRRLYSLLKENETLIRIGAYQKGTDKELDEAIDKKEKIEEFLKQDESLSIDYKDTIDRLIKLME